MNNRIISYEKDKNLNFSVVYFDEMLLFFNELKNDNGSSENEKLYAEYILETIKKFKSCFNVRKIKLIKLNEINVTNN